MSIEMTPSDVVWAALLKTPTVTVTKGDKEKVISYKVPAFGDVPDAKCWLCGGDTGGRGLPKKDRITKMFSDIEYAQFPESQSLCEACGGLLSNAVMRFYSVLATDDSLQHPTRRQWRDILLEPPRSHTWVGCLAVSCQKHLFYRGVVNFRSDECTVALEDIRITYRPGELRELLSIVEPLLETFSKEEVLTGRYRQDRIRQHGLARWQDAERGLERIRGSRILDLAIHVAIKEYRDTRNNKKRESEGDVRCSPCESQLSLLSTSSQR